jgi:hypothetical protein
MPIIKQGIKQSIFLRSTQEFTKTFFTFCHTVSWHAGKCNLIYAHTKIEQKRKCYKISKYRSHKIKFYFINFYLTKYKRLFDCIHYNIHSVISLAAIYLYV